MADGKEYVSRPDELGNIHISEEVLGGDCRCRRH